MGRAPLKFVVFPVQHGAAEPQALLACCSSQPGNVPEKRPYRGDAMKRFEHRYLGWDRFPEPLAAIEIEQFFGLTGAELACVQARRTPLHRTAVALHIGFLKMTGRPLNSVEIVPEAVLAHLGGRLDCTPPRIASRAGVRRPRRSSGSARQRAVISFTPPATPWASCSAGIVTGSVVGSAGPA